MVIQALGTVRYTSLYRWIAQGRFGRFAVYRLKQDHADTIPRFITELDKFIGLPYNSHYDMDDNNAVYCSELVYKAYRNATGEGLGILVKLGDLDWKPYAHTITKVEGRVPLQRIMITPKHLSEAKQLEKIYGFDL
jgi:hypothetical protein